MSVAPAVSVILPVHNRPEYLIEAAESILAQTFRDLELLIVDDCSDNPQTARIAADIAAKDPRVRVIRREKNGGVAAARNTGAVAARAPLIALMDDDDISEPQRLEKQVAFLKDNPEVASVACRKVIINRRGRFVKFHSPPRKTVAVSRPAPPAAAGDDIPTASVGDFAPLDASAVFRRECFDAIGGYRECYRAAEDHDIILRMREKFVMAELPEALYRYRQFRGARVSTSQHNWRANIAIDISARRRRLGRPDPMADGQLLDDEFILAHFGELPATRRAYFIGKFAGPARRLMRAGEFAELRKLLAFAETLCQNESERRTLSRVRMRVLWWSVVFGKALFWWGRA